MNHFVFYKLPPPIVLYPLPLVSIYFTVFVLDYFLLCIHRRQQLHASSRISQYWLLCCIALYHVALPLTFVSNSPSINVFFAAAPIYLVFFTGHLPSHDLFSIPRYIKALSMDLVDQNQDGNVRCDGLSKVARGAFKMSLIYSVLDPWCLASVNDNLLVVLQDPWYTPSAMLYNLFLGIKAYCLLGVVDMFLGAEQAISGVRFIDVFHSPILSSSPRDFWSRRWNMIVRRQFHQHIFMPQEQTKKDTPKKQTGRNGRGLIVFILSGVLHELIIWSICREITLENLLFFTLHGLAVLLETSVTRNQRRQDPWALLWCRLAFLIFMTLSARLFVAPFVRHDFLSPLDITFSLTT